MSKILFEQEFQVNIHPSSITQLTLARLWWARAARQGVTLFLESISDHVRPPPRDAALPALRSFTMWP
jgi:hypothetical protein